MLSMRPMKPANCITWLHYSLRVTLYLPSYTYTSLEMRMIGYSVSVIDRTEILPMRKGGSVLLHWLMSVCDFIQFKGLFLFYFGQTEKAHIVFLGKACYISESLYSEQQNDTQLNICFK